MGLLTAFSLIAVDLAKALQPYFDKADVEPEHRKGHWAMTAALEAGSTPLGSPGIDSGPASPHSGICPSQALALTSATVTPLLAMGRELLLPKLTFPCSCQEESWVRSTAYAPSEAW